MHKVLVLGGGKIGMAVAKMLHHAGDYEVTVADKDEATMTRLGEALPVTAQVADVTQTNVLMELMAGQELVISACPFDLNSRIADACLAAESALFGGSRSLESPE